VGNEEMKEESKGKEGNITISVTSGAFPLKLFKEWDEDCKKLFGNCRWMKMWNDHLASRRMNTFSFIMEEIEKLKIRIEGLEKKPRDEDEEVRTLGEVIK